MLLSALAALAALPTHVAHHEVKPETLQPDPVDWRSRAAALAAQVTVLSHQLESLKSAAAAEPARIQSGLRANLQVAMLDEAGAIRMPESTTRVVLEIGCSNRNTMDEEYLPTHDNGVFLISFEPMLDKYAELLARGNQRYHHGATDQAVPLGHHHERGVVLPLAVTEHGGQVAFNVGSVAGCSSVLRVNMSTSWGQWCKRSLEQRDVPSMTLAGALALAGSKPIEHIKMDAQGVDARLISATDQALFRSKVRSLKLETVADDCNALYEGQMKCGDTIRIMKSRGYRLTKGPADESCSSQAWKKRNRSGNDRCEGDLEFERVGVED